VLSGIRTAMEDRQTAGRVWLTGVHLRHCDVSKWRCRNGATVQAK
jgi:hypothetical protein